MKRKRLVTGASHPRVITDEVSCEDEQSSKLIIPEATRLAAARSASDPRRPASSRTRASAISASDVSRTASISRRSDRTASTSGQSPSRQGPPRLSLASEAMTAAPSTPRELPASPARVRARRDCEQLSSSFIHDPRRSPSASIIDPERRYRAYNGSFEIERC